jgi:IclR family KDG regulon transcriptional repressor
MTRSVVRALSILEAFDTDDPSLSLGDLSRITGIAKATVFRLVATLENAGYLLRLEDNRLCLAPKLATMAAAVRSNMGIREIARPLMLDLCRRTSEIITLNELGDLERICIDVVDTPSPLMTIVKRGEHASLLFGATGKILLAWMDPSAIDAAIAKLAPRERSRIDRTSLVRQLERFRAQGFAMTRGERVPGGTAIAVAVPDPDGQVRHCLALTGPSVRVDPRARAFTAMVVEVGRKLTSKLGGRTPSAGEESAPVGKKNHVGRRATKARLADIAAEGPAGAATGRAR